MSKRKNIRYEDAKKTGVCMIVSCHNPVYKTGAVWCKEHNEKYRARGREYSKEHRNERTKQQRERRARAKVNSQR
jgi:hypothetical protein